MRLPFRKNGETRAICYFSNGKISLPGLYRAGDRSSIGRTGYSGFFAEDSH